MFDVEQNDRNIRDLFNQYIDTLETERNVRRSQIKVLREAWELYLDTNDPFEREHCKIVMDKCFAIQIGSDHNVG